MTAEEKSHLMQQSPSSTTPDIQDAKYKIVDCNDVEMPLINDRLRTHDEAKELLERLNRNGEHRPYRMIRAWKTKLT